NALGWHHRDAARLERLQDRLSFASVVLRAGTKLVDLQTVALGQEHLVDTGWTTRGEREDRGKGDATRSTHIRYRHYQADSAVLVALRLAPADEAPTLDNLAQALDEPERPLFIGRKACLPALPLVLKQVEAAGLVEALIQGLVLAGGATSPGSYYPGSYYIEWPAGTASGMPGLKQSRTLRVVDRLDWRNHIHSGERVLAVGTLSAPAPGESAP
ncbi:MAG: type I-E CRISPR-associated protein Cas5/CasD, partial [Opitutae bacterium]